MRRYPNPGTSRIPEKIPVVLLIAAITVSTLVAAYLVYVSPWGRLLDRGQPASVTAGTATASTAPTSTAPTGPEPAPALPRRNQQAKESAGERVGPRPTTPRASAPALTAHPLYVTLARHVEAGNLRMPILMRSAGAVLAHCSDPSCGAARLSAQIELDQALTGHILRMANSVAYAPEKRVTTLGLAIMRLGFDRVKELAVMVTMKERVLRAGPPRSLDHELVALQRCADARVKNGS